MKTKELRTAGGAIQAVRGRRYTSDEARWTAVVRRDPAADGEFLYSVTTTGVYCRPSCGARRAHREHVRFHESCEEAERAGFRACKRCRPAGPGLAGAHAELVAAACRRIETSEEPPGLAALAEAAGMSRFHFHRVFTKRVGLTPKAYAAGLRAERMREGLDRRGTVTEAIYGAGFNSSGRFYAQSGRVLGMAPARYRRGGEGEAIRFAIGKCSLGRILVAASGEGICSIAMGDDPGRLRRELLDRFPKARRIKEDRQFRRVVARVIRFVEKPGDGFDLPLDVRGTAFQRRVWNALCRIPAGATTSYSELAGQIRMPRAARAVAAACASNAIAVAIPCHRVLRSDGSLSGYRWGVWRKRSLLELEKRKPGGSRPVRR